MGKWIKIGGAAVAVLIAAVVVAFLVLLSSLDSIIVAAVEKYGSEVTGTRVTLDGASVSPTSGQGGISGLTVGNPRGFKTDRAIHVGAISVKVDISTLTDDVIVIKEIVVSNPEITYELGAGGSNIDAIEKNVDAYMAQQKKASRAGQKKAAGDTAAGADEGGPKVIIENLYIRGGTIRISATALGGKKISVPLPDLHRRNIGKKAGGASPGAAIGEVLGSVVDGVGRAVGGIDIKGLGEGIGKALKGLFK